MDDLWIIKSTLFPALSSDQTFIKSVYIRVLLGYFVFYCVVSILHILFRHLVITDTLKQHLIESAYKWNYQILMFLTAISNNYSCLDDGVSYKAIFSH